jgi:hypothetical protein
MRFQLLEFGFEEIEKGERWREMERGNTVLK